MKGRRAGLFVLVLLLIIGLLSDVTLLPLVAMLGIMALLAVELWEWRMFKHVDYQRELGHTHLFPDNRTTLSITLRNRKFLPLPFVNLHDLVPVGITLEQIETQPAASPNYRVLARAFGISSYQQVTRQYTILCPQRGLHRFGPANLSASDPLGLSISRATINEIDRLIVYPRLLTEPELGLPLRELLGTIRALQRLLTDPVVPIGIRDYTQSDPLKSIHWTATARRGQLQTRIYEPVTALTVMCILDIETIVPSYLGVNKFQVDQEAKIAAFKIDDSIRILQTEKLQSLKSNRNPGKVDQCLQELSDRAVSGENLMPAVVEAVANKCTLGEIADTLREVFGEYK